MNETSAGGGTGGGPQDSGGHDATERSDADDYHFSLSETFAEAWAVSKGNKWLLNVVVLVFLLVSLAFSALDGLVNAVFGDGGGGLALFGLVASLCVAIAANGFNGVMTSGVIVLGAKLSLGEEGGVQDLFRFLPRLVTAVLTQVLMVLAVLIGLLLLVLPGIYLLIAYSFAMPLALEKGLSPWQALETSRKAVSKRWFRFLGLSLACTALLIAGLLTLGIGLIWVLPLCILAYGIVYR
ncbi:MAG: hypothetical protein KDI09_01235, partial [Halioglobus sp.]|nr:hypothetical protein [Halioglobus sp.]